VRTFKVRERRHVPEWRSRAATRRARNHYLELGSTPRQTERLSVKTFENLQLNACRYSRRKPAELEVCDEKRGRRRASRQPFRAERT
jgi:hypothetical protein